MTAKNFNGLALLLATAAVLVLTCRPRRLETQLPLNILIICMDTVREDTFWLPEKAGMPDNLSPWLMKAVNYQDTQSVSSWTAPAVASVMTGVYPRTHGGGQFSASVANLDSTLPNRMPARIVTLPEVLAAERYRTLAMISNPFITPETGILQGMHRVEFLDTKSIPSRFAQWVDGYRKLNPIAPFFVYLHLMDAHGEHWKTMKDVDTLGLRLDAPMKQVALRSAPEAVCGDSESEMCRRYIAYVTSVLDLRASIAIVLQALNDQGLMDETGIILFSDHGEEFFDHRDAEIASGRDPRNRYGTGHGHAMYQELLRVPLLLWHPGLPAAVAKTETSLLDVFPTAIALAIADRDVSVLPGRSLVGPSDMRTSDRVRMASGIAYGPEQVATRWKDWKRIRFTCPEQSVLFNLRTDPGELTTVINPAVEREMARLTAKYDLTRPANDSDKAGLTEEQIESLRSLGYLGQTKSSPVSSTDCK